MIDYLKGINMNTYYTNKTKVEWKNIPNDWFDWSKDFQDQKCLHELCPDCNGTGIKKNGLGMCVHGISCPCKKCSVRC